MVNHVGRSRGCQQCRQRKIKCDERVPECSQCLKGGRVCAGPLQGTLFISLDAKTKGTARVRDNKPQRPQRRQRRKSIIDPLPSSFEADVLPANGHQVVTQELTRRQPDVQLPSLYQPSRANPFQQLFIEHFTTEFFGRRSQESQNVEWAYELPSFLYKSPSGAVGYAIRAATMAHYGKRTGNMSFQIDACRWYAKGLETQRLQSRQQQLHLANGKDINEVLTDACICAPIMFGIFETIISTSLAAWAQHFKAAGKFLEMKGPKQCQRGILHPLFRTVRLAAVYIGITWDKPSVFANDDWCEIPFIPYRKSFNDKIADILLQFPGCFVLRNRLRSERAHWTAASEIISHELESKVMHLLARLGEFWKGFRDEVDPNYNHDLYMEMNDFRGSATDWIMGSIQDVQFRDGSAARNIAHYDSAVMLANALLSESGTDPSKAHGRNIVIHSASILAATVWHKRIGPESGGAASLIFPMKVVYQCTPSKHQKKQAHEALLTWGEDRGTEDLCRLWSVEADEDFYNAI